MALIGIVALLHMGTIHWKDIANNTNAVSYIAITHNTVVIFSLDDSGKHYSGLVDLLLSLHNYQKRAHLPS